MDSLYRAKCFVKLNSSLKSHYKMCVCVFIIIVVMGDELLYVCGEGLLLCNKYKVTCNKSE